MNPKSFQIFAITLLCAAAADSAASIADELPAKSSEKPPAYLLRYRFHEGEQLRYQSRQEVRQLAVAAAGQKVDVSKVEQRRLFSIGKVSEEGDARVSMQFEHVRMEAKSDDRPPEVFDSTMKDAEVPRLFRATAHRLKGAAPEYTVHADGTPVSEDGYEEVPEGGYASFMMPLPEEPIAVGDSWKVYMNVKVRVGEGVMRKIKLLRTYKLQSVQDSLAQIRFSTSVAVRVRSPSAKAQLLQATPQGTITFDVDRGRVVKKEMTFERSVIGALGANTMLTATGKTVETLIEAESEDVSSVTPR